MAGSYWQRVTLERLKRRRLLTGVGAAGVSALALSLIGCGGGGDDEKETVIADKSGLLSTPVDTTSQAKTGGTFKGYRDADVPQGFDVLATNNAQTQSVAIYAYPRLFKFTPGRYPKLADGSSEGDIAESYELSADKLQLTVKLRQGAKWDARAPTNNRVIDAQDVVFSWNKFARLNAAAQDLAYDAAKAPGAPVESVSSPDNRTVVFKLKQPDSSIIPLFTAYTHFYVMPRESESGFDPKSTVRGHGPFTLEEYRPSVSFAWKKNPDYYMKDRPFFDRLEQPIVPEYATRLAQFKAGNIWNDVHGLLQQDVVQTKRDVPKALLRQDDLFAFGVSSFLSFGYEGNSPWKDQRLRQAMSMLVDREGFIDVIANRDGFKKDGLELPVAYHSIVGAGWTGYWLDPFDEKGFGPNAKYLKLNIAEAKKLASAAGFPNGLEFDFFYNGGTNYGPTYHKIAELYIGNFEAGGFKAKSQPIPYQTYYENYYLGYLSKDFAAGTKKGFNGVIYGAEKTYPTVPAQLFGTLHKDGAIFHGLTPDGAKAHLGDPKLNDMIEKVKLETERNKQQALVHDVIRYATGQAYNIPRPATSKNFNVWWPVIGNLGVYPNYSGGHLLIEPSFNWWIDTTKPPLAG
ncbi:MAG TPA: ABC transporter substrate-binding protein [Dehalococcoidia bacterium]|nr:ABC transporter substrate-binding protein [Dehalococcoidia bacterium]